MGKTERYGTTENLKVCERILRFSARACLSTRESNEADIAFTTEIRHINTLLITSYRKTFHNFHYQGSSIADRLIKTKAPY